MGDVSLGQALSAAIRHGAGAALQELETRNSEVDLAEALEQIQELQQAFAVALRGLYEPMKDLIPIGESKLPDR